MSRRISHIQGFTLIELSIVLVIIGLLVGGVLTGQNLIKAAEARAQISQIDRFNTAVNTFQEKYGALPGDMTASTAAQFGFAARGIYAGEGDGNGLLQGVSQNGYSNPGGINYGAGETVMFWSDLTYANGLNINLIEGNFNQASSTSVTGVNSSLLPQYFPSAKLGSGNYVYVYSGWYFTDTWVTDGINYFGLSAVSSINAPWYTLAGNAGLTVQQAYSIDMKVDDGLPQSGNVLAAYPSGIAIVWAGTANVNNMTYVTATPGSSTSCFDNGNVGGATQQYSVKISNGANPNCALSFRFQ